MSRIEFIAVSAMLGLFLIIVVALFVSRPISVIQGYLDRLDFKDKNLPFTDQFVDDQGWVPIGGEVTLDQGLLVKSSAGSAGGAAFLEGSSSWRDYWFQAQIEGQVGQNVGLIARLVDRSNFVTCNYNGDSVRIDQRLKGVTTTLARGTRWRSFAASEGDFGIKVVGQDVSCLIADTTIVETSDLDPVLNRGAIGFKSFDSVLNHSQITVGSARVEPMQPPSSRFLESCYDGHNRARPDRSGQVDPPVASSSVWLEIYETYPCTAGGKEVAYESLEDWDIEIANGMIEDTYSIPRFDPVQIGPITWNEDPYGEQYWRFVFYSLRPTGQLLQAWRETGDEVYRRKLLEIIDSYTKDGMDGPYSWDQHGAAWRTMVLVNTWWKLREGNGLPRDIGVKVLEALEAHGNFLADETHYEANYNHGVNQALALYILAVNFPDLPGAQSWALVASGRLDDGVSRIVDQDGILVENSPYYHLYTTGLYWGIRRYLEQNDLPVSDVLAEKLGKMVSYAAYVIQPDLRIPTIGASQSGEVKLAGIYQEMASSDPHLLYVLTQGAEGLAPPERNVHFPVAGQTIMRSGWDAGEDFAEQTQIIFDVGSYRTNHSDFDALSFHLFSKGVALLPDSGLYTYEDGPWRSYFHGTASHNTVVVDGLDQDTTWRTAANGSIVLDIPKKVFPGSFYEGDGFVYQSAQHNLYDGVIHRRAVVLIQDDLVLIVDNLVSNLPHTYQQKFHLFPQAELTSDGLKVVATGDKPGQMITISQLLERDIALTVARGETSPVDGFCSEQYEIAVPCYALTYAKDARTTSYVTLLKIGEPDPAVIARVDPANQLVTIATDLKEHTFSYDLRPEFNLPNLRGLLEP
ncbi:MAG TPA: alginate lyase family protein, partial [Dehalococcoidia bacterium]|nr:alginate lyase family protein [Dehalococcoidia bacterium]